MGGALAMGLVRSGAVSPGDMTVTARHLKTLSRFKRAGIRTSTDNVSAVRDADIVFYAVKPWQMQQVARETAPALDYSRQTVVSIAPGVSKDNLLEWFSPKQDAEGGQQVRPQIAYVIPNTAVEIGESMTFISSVTADDARVEVLKRLLDKVGRTQVVGLDRMIAGTCVASCGIAYAMRYISASGKGALHLGLPSDSIREVVCQTVRGAASLIENNESDPETEIDRVTTPNGMTIKGLNAMEASGFSKSVIDGLTVRMERKHRIVVKVGSNVLTREDGGLDTTRVSAIVDQVYQIRRLGYEVILVTSGAVACGRSLIRQNDKLDEVQQRQLYSAIGQVRLMDLYYKLFIDYGINVGQVLTMKKDFSGKKEYGNMRNCMEVMLHSNVVPIVNENDTVSIKELMFTDNDELSGLVAVLMGCDKLVILTNVDGIYDGNPSEEGSSLIRSIRPKEDFSSFISDSRSSLGRGGMHSKYKIARDTAAAGIKVIIANGKRDNVLYDVLVRPESVLHTEFLTNED